MTTNHRTTDPFTCATCQIEIAGTPTFHVGLAFCCAGCVAGGPCICSYDDQTTMDTRVRHCADIEGLLERAEFATAREPVLAASR